MRAGRFFLTREGREMNEHVSTSLQAFDGEVWREISGVHNVSFDIEKVKHEFAGTTQSYTNMRMPKVSNDLLMGKLSERIDWDKLFRKGER